MKFRDAYEGRHGVRNPVVTAIPGVKLQGKNYGLGVGWGGRGQGLVGFLHPTLCLTAFTFV